MMSCYEENFRFTDGASECPMRSKARIDSLFDDSRSIYSSTIGGWYDTISNRPSSLNPEELNNEEQNSANGAVQARIEAMFASVEAETGTPGESSAALLKVKYIGAAPVGGRVASIKGLQEPLRHLAEQVNRSLRAELEISHRGLTYRSPEIPEKTNPFRRIAVWSALRLRCKKSPSGEILHAFLPLVGDDQSSPVLRADEKHAELYRAMRGLNNEVRKYPPIFAVVMRRPGAAKLLECHAFACRVEEDAIAAAATLYRALLADMDANRRRPRQTNGLGCVSLASVASSVVEPSIGGARSIFGNNHSRSRLEAPSSLATDGATYFPVRPPRSKKNSVSGSQTDRNSVRSLKLEKAPRKKKISEVKAEDILEARSRKAQITNSRVAALKEIRDDISVARSARIVANDGNCNTCKSNNSCGTRNPRPKNKERNFRNKIAQQENREPGGGDDNTIYNEKPEYSAWRGNNYEKLPKISKSFAYETNPEIHYSFVEKNSIVDKELGDFYERDAESYDLKMTANGFTNLETGYITSKPKIELETQSLGYEWIPKGNRSRESSIYSVKAIEKLNSREKLYDERLRDADKIYSIGQEDLLMSGKRRNSRSVNNLSSVDRKYSISMLDGGASIGHRSTESVTKTVDRGRENSYGFERSNAINTLDKPTRRQLANGLSEGKTKDGPKVRKRSRACSEPPVSRTEESLKNLEEPKLTRSQSELEVDRGDLMTRVELPRRCSFLKSGGSTRLPNNVQGGTPLGFTELFDEFRNQEGLTSVDDILAAIIDPEGMSFNDLKPLYKEFLLKLAATLTQDELYQRSASIMRRRRRPQRRRSTRKPGLLGRAIKRSVSRLKGGPTEFTSVIFPAKKLNDSFDSSSSCDIRNNNNGARVLASRLTRRHSSWRNTKSGVGQTTSEDSDTGRRLARNGGGIAANRSSSGYVSCSECSYDSESCTCVSADKCYCSLPRRASATAASSAATAITATATDNTVICACDTDSCSDSNKCYCPEKSTNGQPTILEQLRQRGIVPAESTLSRNPSPDRGKTNARTNRSHASSKSLEFLKIRPSPGRSSSDNLALDYDLFSPGKKSQHSLSTGNEKVLVVSARDPQGRLVYVGGGGDSDKIFQNGASRTEAHREALSIKKSAEIAAIFGPGSVRACRRASSISSVRSSISLEAGLGYLP